MTTHSSEGLGGRATLERNLGFLATKAAVELDDRRRGILSASTDAVMKLGEVLGERVADKQAQPATKALLDPITADLFGRRFGPGAIAGESAQQVKDWAKQFASRLRSVGPNTPIEELTELRDLCVALAQRAEAKSTHLRTLRMKNRFRR